MKCDNYQVRDNRNCSYLAHDLNLSVTAVIMTLLWRYWSNQYDFFHV